MTIAEELRDRARHPYLEADIINVMMKAADRIDELEEIERFHTHDKHGEPYDVIKDPRPNMRQF